MSGARPTTQPPIPSTRRFASPRSPSYLCSAGFLLALSAARRIAGDSTTAAAAVVTPPTFEIYESQIDGWLRLSLTGELDLASAPVLEDRLACLRAFKHPVRPNLSKLDFIDSTGIHLVIRTLGEARVKHWELQIEPDVNLQVTRLFKLVHIEDLVFNGEAEVPPAGRAQLRPASS